jgi:RNA polymerase sigma-70 factor (ECF subfamily)
LDERKAVARLKNGDIGGLEVLVRLYQDRALRATFLITRDHALSEDIVQTAFVRAYERIHQFNDDKSFGPWFLHSVVNDSLMAVTRKREVSMDMLSEGVVSSISMEAGPDQALEVAETREAIVAALDKLSPKQRAAVVARYYLGLTDVESAATLDCPPGTVRQRLHDARLTLRRLLPAWVQPTYDE